MKIRIFTFLIFACLSITAQNLIKGKVVSINNTPLEGASVYLNNTTVGTITNANGEFSFETKSGQFELIISFLGFEKINYSLHTSSNKTPLLFKLKEAINQLDEVIIKKVVYDEEWRHNLAVFKREFIGQTLFAKNCKIQNPKVLYFDFNKEIGVLTAFAKEPLIIKNNSLGYLITFELENFTRTKTHTTYLGYSRYKTLKGNKRKQRKWKENRLKAYNGSPVHFYKSLINNTFIKEGFIVNQFKRFPNPDRPSDIEIQKARELFKLNRNFALSINNRNKEPKTALDTAMVVLNKARLPKFKDFLYKSKLQQNELLKFENNLYKLSFNDHIIVVYNKEKEEKNYALGNIFSKKRAPLNVQTSSIIQRKRFSILDKSGVLTNPLNVFFEGYWAYEKFANSLPLDYQPEE